VMLTVGIVISACGGEDSSSSSPASEATTMTASPDEQLCQDREALEDSIEALADVDVVAEGTSGVGGGDRRPGQRASVEQFGRGGLPA
jgi:hypothetical protein